MNIFSFILNRINIRPKVQFLPSYLYFFARFLILNQFEILAKQFLGADNLYTLRIPDGQQVLCTTPSHIDKDRGEKLPVILDIEHLVVLPDISV